MSQPSTLPATAAAHKVRVADAGVSRRTDLIDAHQLPRLLSTIRDNPFMSGTKVIITFQTKSDSSSAFAALLGRIAKELPKVTGCKGVRVFASTDNPCIFTLLEDWDSDAAHKTHISAVVASGVWQSIAQHLSTEPVSHYYGELAVM